MLTRHKPTEAKEFPILISTVPHYAWLSTTGSFKLHREQPKQIVFQLNISHDETVKQHNPANPVHNSHAFSALHVVLPRD
jgi:hypothetical protein